MSNWIESLESRSLFSAAIPSDLAAEYQVVLGDNVAVKAVVKNLTTLVTDQDAVLQKDVTALGKNKTNAVLFAAVKKAATQYEAAVKTATTRYLAAAGQLRKSELAEAAFDDDPDAVNTRTWDAAQLAGERVDSQKLFPLMNQYSTDSIAALDAKIDALDAANGGAGTLDVDVQGVKTALVDRVEINNTTCVNAYVDIDTLFDGSEL